MSRYFRYKQGLRLAGRKRTKNALVDNETVEANSCADIELNCAITIMEATIFPLIIDQASTKISPPSTYRANQQQQLQPQQSLTISQTWSWKEEHYNQYSIITGRERRAPPYSGQTQGPGCQRTTHRALLAAARANPAAPL
jgi:hypothetical protein